MTKFAKSPHPHGQFHDIFCDIWQKSMIFSKLKQIVKIFPPGQKDRRPSRKRQTSQRPRALSRQLSDARARFCPYARAGRDCGIFVADGRTTPPGLPPRMRRDTPPRACAVPYGCSREAFSCAYADARMRDAVGRAKMMAGASPRLRARADTAGRANSDGGSVPSLPPRCATPALSLHVPEPCEQARVPCGTPQTSSQCSRS